MRTMLLTLGGLGTLVLLLTGCARVVVRGMSDWPDWEFSDLVP